MFNGMPEGGGGEGEGYVPVAGGAKGSIQQRVQIFLGETVTQCSFQLANDHFFFLLAIRGQYFLSASLSFLTLIGSSLWSLPPMKS